MLSPLTLVATVKRVKVKGMADMRVLVAEDHDVVRAGIRLVLEAEADIRVVAEAKIRAVDEKVRALRHMRRALRTVLETCRCGGDVSRCLVLDGRDDTPPARRRRS